MNELKSIMSRKLFGLFINEKRQIIKMSLRKFAQKIKISPEYLSKIENGERPAPKSQDHNYSLLR